MKKELFDSYNRYKASFIEDITDSLKTLEVKFSPYIKLSLPRDSDEFLEEISDISYDAKEDTWYAHNYVTDTELCAEEYYTPLRDLSFDELFKIAERL